MAIGEGSLYKDIFGLNSSNNKNKENIEESYSHLRLGNPSNNALDEVLTNHSIYLPCTYSL